MHIVERLALGWSMHKLRNYADIKTSKIQLNRQPLLDLSVKSSLRLLGCREGEVIFHGQL